MMKTKKCLYCGKESTLFFGFATPCSAPGSAGSHGRFVEVETSEENEYRKLKLALQGSHWYDRRRFWESTSELAMTARAILAKYNKQNEKG